jgi:acetyl esterase/lipase
MAKTDRRKGAPMVAAAALVLSGAAQAGTPVDADGLDHMPAMIVPPSSFLSPQARDAYIKATRAPRPMDPIALAPVVGQLRAGYDATLKVALERTRALYPVKVEHETIAGTPVEVVTPKAGVSRTKAHKVLINLHGGAFMLGGGGPGGLMEAIPVAAIGGYRVITVDYRMAPEHHFPDASEDVAAVYAALLKTYKPGHIGIYGCSSGGTLTAQATVWFQTHGLPRPGAIGVLCASLSPNFGGDSAYLAPPLNGNPPPDPPVDGQRWKGTGETPYMARVDLSSPLAQPLGHPDVLARFPPTLFITSTRAPEMSAAVYSHAQLVKAGARADLHVFEGLWHGFAGDVALPESRDYQDVIVRFFDRELQR